MRIAVVGAGAIGSASGALLARADHEVLLVGRSAHVAATRADSLRVDGCLGAFSVKVTAVEQLDRRPDLALITTKTQDVQTAVTSNRAVLADVPVLTIQNGVRGAELAAEILGHASIWSGVTLMMAN